MKFGLSRLLSGRNRLSQLEKETILEQVLTKTARRSRARWWMVTVPVVAAAAAAMLLVVRPWTGEHPDAFATRGGASAVAAFRPTCTRECKSGDKLLFDVRGTRGYRYFAAFARRADGTVLWYFPEGVDLETQPPGGVLDRGILIDREHPPGAYRVFGVFSFEPMSRDQIRERFDETRATAGPGTKVLEQELVVP